MVIAQWRLRSGDVDWCGAAGGLNEAGQCGGRGVAGCGTAGGVVEGETQLGT